MPGQSLTTVIGGPCIITHRGGTFRSKGDVRLSAALELFPVETSLYGVVDSRVREEPLKVSFVPDGEWSNLGVLWPYAAFPIGQTLTPQLPFGAIAANQVTIAGVGGVIQSGDAIVCQVQGSGTITSGLVAGTTYYLHLISANVVSIHTTYANAVAGTNPIAITAGSGQTVAVVNNPLAIQSLDGVLLTFANAAVSKMPNLSLSTVKTAIGGVEFTCYPADGQDWSGTNSRYTAVNNPWPGDTGFNPASILTGEIQAVWGSVAPWANFDIKDGWEVDFSMSLENVEVDNVGLIAHRLSNIDVTAKAIPLGVQTADILTALALQGATASRGRSLGATGNNLLLSAVANNLGCKLYQAGLEGGPLLWSNKLERPGQLTWRATRTFGASGPNPLFFIGNTNVT